MIALSPELARADPLAGDAAAATSSPEGVRRNPANFAFVERSYIDLSPRLFEVNQLFARYPGFNTVVKETRGVSPINALSFAPSSVDGSSKLGFALTELLPPVTIDFDIKELPVVVFDQLMFVDVRSRVQLRGGIGGAMAYRATNRLGLGLSANYRSVALDSTLHAAGDENELARVRTTLDTQTVNAGFRYEMIPGRLSIGMSSTILHRNDVKFAFKGGAFFSEEAGAGAEKPATLQVGRSVLFGMHAFASRWVSVLADAEYTRADKTATRFSLVDFEEQRLDVYDTLAVRAGFKLYTKNEGVFSVGYVNEPASVGAGERGPGSTTGFGTIDFVPVFAGIEDLKPYWRVVGGYGRSFGWTVTRGSKGYHKWYAAAGLALQESSLGIAEDGELPGAYRQRKFIVPVQVTYRY